MQWVRHSKPSSTLGCFELSRRKDLTKLKIEAHSHESRERLRGQTRGLIPTAFAVWLVDLYFAYLFLPICGQGKIDSLLKYNETPGQQTEPGATINRQNIMGMFLHSLEDVVEYHPNKPAEFLPSILTSAKSIRNNETTP